MSRCKLLGCLNSCLCLCSVWVFFFSTTKTEVGKSFYSLCFVFWGTGWTLRVGWEEGDGLFYFVVAYKAGSAAWKTPSQKKRNRKPAWTVNSVLLSQPKSGQLVPVRQRLHHSIFDTFKWMSFLKDWGHVSVEYIYAIYEYIVYISIYIYIYMFIYTHVCVYMDTCAYTYMCVLIYVL